MARAIKIPVIGRCSIMGAIPKHLRLYDIELLLGKREILPGHSNHLESVVPVKVNLKCVNISFNDASE